MQRSPGSHWTSLGCARRFPAGFISRPGVKGNPSQDIKVAAGRIAASACSDASARQIGRWASVTRGNELVEDMR